MNDEKLIQLAIEARKNAFSPSNYYVGVVILTENDKIYTGCNIGTEDVLFNFCAEKVAIVKMLSEGKEIIKKIAIVGGKQNELVLTLPCGSCRQLLMEISPKCEVICGYKEDGQIKQNNYSLSDLLPSSYAMN